MFIQTTKIIGLIVQGENKYLLKELYVKTKSNISFMINKINKNYINN